MKIRLNEIPAEGREYTFDRESAELNEDLRDLLADRDYVVDMSIEPIGGGYQLRGKVVTTLKEVCSKCGWDFDLPITRPMNEILFEEQEDHRKSHSVHGNQSVDFLGQGPSMTTYTNNAFDPGEYVHEVIALAEPFYPTCGENDSCLRADEASEILRRLESEFIKAEEKKSVGHPAFSVLQGLELSRKN